jgi:hypothetical protein
MQVDLQKVMRQLDTIMDALPFSARSYMILAEVFSIIALSLIKELKTQT